MPLEAYWLIALLVCVSLGATARWVLLHPDRFFIKGMFAEPDSLRARVGRFQATFFLFGGAVGLVLYATSLMRMPDSPAVIASLIVGSYLAYRLRKPAKS